MRKDTSELHQVQGNSKRSHQKSGNCIEGKARKVIRLLEKRGLSAVVCNVTRDEHRLKDRSQRLEIRKHFPIAKVSHTGKKMNYGMAYRRL